MKPLVFSLLILAALAAARPREFTGTITDDMCAAGDHSRMIACRTHVFRDGAGKLPGPCRGQRCEDEQTKDERLHVCLAAGRHEVSSSGACFHDPHAALLGILWKTE